jgi:hypothetical protein
MKKFNPHSVDWPQIDRFLVSADRKLASAHKILEFDEEACLQQAYEAMLKASLAFMFSHGFRARSQPGHHIAIIDFVRASRQKACLIVDSLRPAPPEAQPRSVRRHRIRFSSRRRTSSRIGPSLPRNPPRRRNRPQALSKFACLRPQPPQGVLEFGKVSIADRRTQNLGIEKS